MFFWGWGLPSWGFKLSLWDRAQACSSYRIWRVHQQHQQQQLATSTSIIDTPTTKFHPVFRFQESVHHPDSTPRLSCAISCFSRRRRRRRWQRRRRRCSGSWSIGNGRVLMKWGGGRARAEKKFQKFWKVVGWGQMLTTTSSFVADEAQPNLMQGVANIWPPNSTCNGFGLRPWLKLSSYKL